MSQGKRNSCRRDNSRFDVGLAEVCGFLRFLWVASATFFLIAVGGLVFFNPSQASKVAYTITIVSSGITAVSGYIACLLFEKKNEALNKKEKQAYENVKGEKI